MCVIPALAAASVDVASTAAGLGFFGAGRFFAAEAAMPAAAHTHNHTSVTEACKYFFPFAHQSGNVAHDHTERPLRYYAHTFEIKQCTDKERANTWEPNADHPLTKHHVTLQRRYLRLHLLVPARNSRARGMLLLRGQSALLF